jgi:hypothetical protein
VAGKYEVAAYYFPQWHADPKNEITKGKGWSEWVTMKEAKPRFPNHDQPKIPIWGYLDESDPQVSAIQIDAAADHGIDVFLYDWYWDMGGGDTRGPFLHRALEEGFLHAKNKERLKFALMWANHNEINRDRFEAMTDYIIEKYFRYKNYWTVNGGLFFCVYEMHTLIKGLGGTEDTKNALDSFRNKVNAAGLPPLHLNGMEWGLQSRHREIGEKPNELAEYLGVDSVTSYVWMHNISMEHFPDEPYSIVAKKAPELWEKIHNDFKMAYFPNVTMGWDPSPRFDQNRPYDKKEYGDNSYLSSILVGNTPDAFEKSLSEAKDFLDKHNISPRIITLYAWNEWTEGGFLEPEKVHGMGYLEAIKNVFGEE